MAQKQDIGSVLDPAHNSLLKNRQVATFENAVGVTVGLRGARGEGALITDLVHINEQICEKGIPKMAANIKATRIRARRD